jgi:hypothetical protein
MVSGLALSHPRAMQLARTERRTETRASVIAPRPNEVERRAPPISSSRDGRERELACMGWGILDALSDDPVT